MGQALEGPGRRRKYVQHATHTPSNRPASRRIFMWRLTVGPERQVFSYRWQEQMPKAVPHRGSWAVCLSGSSARSRTMATRNG